MEAEGGMEGGVVSASPLTATKNDKTGRCNAKVRTTMNDRYMREMRVRRLRATCWNMDLTLWTGCA